MREGRLDGVVALVTGASSGIGEATARVLASTGAAVALVARREERLEALAAQVGRAGARALVIASDVTAEAEAREAVRRTVAELGRLDVVVNNAGVMLLEQLQAEDIADAVRYVVTRPRRMAVNEILVRPTEQEF